MIDYGNLRKALKNLEVQYENLKNLDDDTPPLMKEGIAESVVQRFEICIDTVWKLLKRYMEEEGFPKVPSAPKPILRMAGKENLLSSTFEQWEKYIDARNKTSHEYGGKFATEVLDIMEDFIDDAIGLYQTMSGETWE